MRRPKAVHQMTSAQFDAMFPVGDEDACKAYLVARRWPNGVVHTNTIEGFRSIFKRGINGDACPKALPPE